jgi:plasmid stabilization system protein ParE
MKPAQVHPDAEAEADAAFEWYWMRSESAALAFDAELRRAFSSIRRSPRIFPP